MRACQNNRLYSVIWKGGGTPRRYQVFRRHDIKRGLRKGARWSTVFSNVILGLDRFFLFLKLLWLWVIRVPIVLFVDWYLLMFYGLIASYCREFNMKLILYKHRVQSFAHDHGRKEVERRATGTSLETFTRLPLPFHTVVDQTRITIPAGFTSGVDNLTYGN